MSLPSVPLSPPLGRHISLEGYMIYGQQALLGGQGPLEMSRDEWKADSDVLLGCLYRDRARCWCSGRWRNPHRRLAQTTEVDEVMRG